MIDCPSHIAEESLDGDGVVLPGILHESTEIANCKSDVRTRVCEVAQTPPIMLR
jgi:hypothetical protein